MSHASQTRRTRTKTARRRSPLLGLAPRIAAPLIAAAAIALGGTATDAHAQQRPPSVSGEIEGKPILTTLLLVVLAGVVFGAAAFPAKRGHQD